MKTEIIKNELIQKEIIDKIPQTIRVTIKQYVEDGDVYYLATSEDVPGFLCEGNTLDEVKSFTPFNIFSLYVTQAEELCKKVDLVIDAMQDIFTQADIDLHYEFDSKLTSSFSKPVVA